MRVFVGLAVAGLCAGLATAGLLTQQADRAAPPPAFPASSAGTRIIYPDGKRVALELPNGQRRTVHSLLNVRRPMSFGEFVWNDEGVPAGKTWVRVDLPRQTLSVFRGADEIGSTVILFGADGKPTPAGVFPILAKAKAHRSTLYDAEMPFMMRLTGDGVAIHASSVREGSATHGCIGVPIAFAKLLYEQAKIGDQVAIIAA